MRMTSKHSPANFLNGAILAHSSFVGVFVCSSSDASAFRVFGFRFVSRGFDLAVSGVTWLVRRVLGDLRVMKAVEGDEEAAVVE